MGSQVLRTDKLQYITFFFLGLAILQILWFSINLAICTLKINYYKPEEKEH